MITILLQKILDLLRENLANMIKFFVTDPQDGQTLVYDAESEEWKNDFVEIELQETASGSVATFNTEATLPLVSLKANITATQSGTGTPSPSNPRPISGFSSVTLTQKDSEDSTVDTFTISLGDTYYGGVLDCKNGTATITWGGVDLSQVQYTTTSWGGYKLTVDNCKPFANANVATCKVSVYATTSYNDLNTNKPNNSIAIASTGAVYLVSDNTPTGQFVFELQTPITLSGLTPDNFTTIAGQNNIFADSGDVEIIYNTTSAQKVWDVANHVKDLTAGLTIDFLTIEEASCNVKAYQQGHMVIVEINYMKYISTPLETAVIITGLPKPVAATYGAMLDTYDSANGIRLRVNTDGELQQWYNRPYPNHEAVGQIVYITDEV